MKRDYKDYIKDIIDAMDKATSFIENMSFEEFREDTKTLFAVVRAIEIIGEAVKNIPTEIREISRNSMEGHGWNERRGYPWVFWC